MESDFLYWDIERGIAEKQEKLGWGKSVVDRLAADASILSTAYATQNFSRKLRENQQIPTASLT